MIPRLVPKILPLDAFCDRVAGVGIGDSRSCISRGGCVFGIKEIAVFPGFNRTKAEGRVPEMMPSYLRH